MIAIAELVFAFTASATVLFVSMFPNGDAWDSLAWDRGGALVAVYAGAAAIHACVLLAAAAIARACYARDGMHVTINGEAREFRASMTIADLVASSRARRRGRSPSSSIARSFRASSTRRRNVVDGDVLEIVHMVGGG